MERRIKKKQELINRE